MENLQNFERQMEGKEIKNAPGYFLIKHDLDQVNAKVMMFLLFQHKMWVDFRQVGAAADYWCLLL